jgi:hypothetical protein
MAVVRIEARLIDAEGFDIGAGTAAIHLPLGHGRAQRASGTLSLRHWKPSGGAPSALLLEQGKRLAIEVSRDAISDCSRSRILRFSAVWQPTD